MISRTPAAQAAMLAGLLSLAVSSNGQEEGAKANPALVGVLVEYFEVEQADATKLLRDHRTNGDAGALREKAGKMAEEKKAKLVETSYLVTRSGQRAKVESIHEYIYPTEFDPAEIPQKLTGPIEKGADITTPANPTAFEMRPVGTTLEVDPVIRGGGELIDVNIAPEIVRHQGNENWGKDEAETEQPVFYSMKLSTATTVRAGGYCLLAVQTPREAAPPLYIADRKNDGKKRADVRILVFLRATVLRLDATEKEEAGVEE